MFAAVILFSSNVFAQSAPESNQETSDDWGDTWGEMDEWEEEAVSPFSYAGFVEFAMGDRVSDDPALGRHSTLRDARVQLQADYALDNGKFTFRGDLYYDGVLSSTETQLRELVWQGSLRELGAWGEHFDLKVGQQVLTWGTGDYLFLNDLFPKDYQSFFSGRQDEYLKSPSLSARLSGYFDSVNIDVVITPQFTPDNGITGEYFSFFNPQLGLNVAPAFSVLKENEPDEAEVAIRLYKTIGQTEWAAYGYRGYTKTPTGADALSRPMYNRLNVLGVSAVQPLGDGLAKVEYAYHDSVDDSHGDNPFVANSQSRFLFGYEQELVANLTGSVQLYSEYTHDHDALMSASYWPEYEQETWRHVITTQLMYRALRQTLTVQGFNFYSPTDEDGYFKLNVSYSPTDSWQLRGGANLFYGQQAHTFYHQFEDASNVFMAFSVYF